MRFLLLLSILVVLLVAFSGFTAWQIERKYPAIGDFIEVDGARLHYLDLGPKDAVGPPLVIFHGASATLKDTKMSLGDALSRKSRVILFDRPGHGYSTRPADGYRLDLQAQLMHQALVRLGIEKPIIIGQSFGGSVALAYTLRYQDQMSGAVLLAPVSHEWPGEVAWYNRASSVPVLGPLLRWTVIPHYGRMVAEKGFNGTFWPQPAPENYYEEAGIALLFRPGAFRNNAADIAHLKSEVIIMSKRYKEITIPVRIYTGTHDTTVSPTIHSYNLVNEVHDGELTFLPQTGHGLHHTAAVQIITGIEKMVSGFIPIPASNIPPAVNAPPADTPAPEAGEVDAL